MSEQESYNILYRYITDLFNDIDEITLVKAIEKILKSYKKQQKELLKKRGKNGNSNNK